MSVVFVIEISVTRSFADCSRALYLSMHTAGVVVGRFSQSIGADSMPSTSLEKLRNPAVERSTRAQGGRIGIARGLRRSLSLLLTRVRGPYRPPAATCINSFVIGLGCVNSRANSSRWEEVCLNRKSR